MIEAIATALLTPASIATPPPNIPAIVQTYDWNTQSLQPSPAVSPGTASVVTFINSHCFISRQFVVDDISGTD